MNSSAFLYGLGLQWKLSIRNKEILVFYIVPLAFYLIMSGVFTSIIPDMNKTIIQTMLVFSVTMAGVMAIPNSIIEYYKSDIKKSYRVGDVPLWTVLMGNLIAGFINLFIISLIIIFSAPILFKAELPTNMPRFFIALALLILASLGVGTIFGIFVNKASKLGLFTQIVFLPSVLLSGIMFPTSMLPKAVQWIGKVLPATWGYEAMCSYEWKSMIPLGIMIVLIAVVSAFKLKAMKSE